MRERTLTLTAVGPVDLHMHQAKHVEAKPVFVQPATRGGQVTRELEIIIDDKYSHRFPSSSRVTKALDVMLPEAIADRLVGGHFLFAEENLLEWRDNTYHGFVHTTASLTQLVNHIGLSHNARGELVMAKTWSNHDITVPFLGDGGEFTSQLDFTWSGFSANVSTQFSIIRQICTNGMRGLTPLLKAKIPLVNRWEEHLNMAGAQVQRKIDNTVSRRVQQMQHEAASVGNLLLLRDHARDRINSRDENITLEHRERLANIAQIASPEIHLNRVYNAEVFTNNTVAQHLPGHLSRLDVYNIATEMSSHTPATNTSTNAGLDKLANNLMFDENSLSTQVGGTAIRQSAFSDPDRAFFGDIDLGMDEGDAE